MKKENGNLKNDNHLFFVLVFNFSILYEPHIALKRLRVEEVRWCV